MSDTKRAGGLAGRFRRRLPAHEVHEVLSSTRRSAALSYLRQEGETSVQTLSEAVATAESGARPAPRDVRLSVYNSLVGPHLPKLAALGLVDYDVEHKRVRALPAARQVTSHTRVLTGLGITWAGYYRALGIVAERPCHTGTEWGRRYQRFLSSVRRDSRRREPSRIRKGI